MTCRFTPNPIHLDTLNPAALPYIGKLVTVRSWHPNISMLDLFPDDERVGFIEEFSMDIPQSELTPP
jgi:hypothetical protein